MKESNAPALKRGLDLIELIARKGPIGFGHLEEESGLNTSSLNRLLKVLTESGFITKNMNGKYELGLKLFTLSYGNSIWQSLYGQIAEILHDISRKFKVTALIYIFMPTGISVLDKVVYPDNVAMRGIGEIKRDYLSSPWGLLYLAQLGEEERMLFIQQMKAENAGDAFLPDEQLDRLVLFAKKKGYADDEALINKNVRRLAVPLYEKDGRLIAALAIGSFINLLDQQKTEELVESLKHYARLLSNKIQGL